MENFRKIEFKELIELFLIFTIPSIQEEEEIPHFNIVFKEGTSLFEYVKKYPFVLERWYTPNITDKDIKRLSTTNNQAISSPTLYVKNTTLFFELLVEIVNESLLLNRKYDIILDEREHCLNVLRRIWLRMGPNDFNNVELFLKRELEFVRNDWLDIDYHKNYEKIGEFYDNTIVKAPFVSATWDETFREVYFSIVVPDRSHSHELSNIRYGLIEENGERVCYIYAIQSIIGAYVDKKILRQLYKICNKNGDLGVHPNQIYTMYLFLKELEKIGVTKIKIPILQVLNYRYHEIMYQQKSENDDDVTRYSEYISYLKTEKLYKVMECMTNFFDDFYLVNDLDTAVDTLDYSFGDTKRK